MIDMIGQWIRYLRKEQGISREVLCRGLCSEEQLRRLELEEQSTEKLVVDALMQRLGKSVNKYDLLLEDKEYDLLLHRVKIQKRLRQAGQEKELLVQAKQEIQLYEKKQGTKTKLQRQFISLQKAELLRRCRAPWGEQWDIVCEGLEQTLEEGLWRKTENSLCKLDIHCLKEHYLSMLEMLLLERYAVLLENVARIEAVNWYRYLMDYISEERQDGAECRTHYPFLAYHMASYYKETNQPDSALEILEKALEMLRISKRQSTLFIKCMEMRQEILRECGCLETVAERADIEKQRLEVFYQLVEGQRDIWLENYYPIYLEIHVHSVSQTIKERRLLLGMTQKQLAENICDVTTLSRLERKKCAPQAWTQEMLLKKLNVTPLKYSGSIVTEDYTDYRRVAMMQKAYNEGEYDKVQDIFEELKKGMSEEYILNRQFIQCWSIRLLSAGGKLEASERIGKLWQLLEMSLGERERHAKYAYVPIGNERMYFHDIVWENRIDDSQSLYDVLKNQHRRMAGTELELLFPEFYLVILYCLGNNAWVLNKGKEALDYAEEMQKKISYFEYESRFGALLFLKAWILKGMGEIGECRKVLRQAYVVETMLARHKKASSYIEAFVQKHFPGSLDDLRIPG